MILQINKPFNFGVDAGLIEHGIAGMGEPSYNPKKPR